MNKAAKFCLIVGISLAGLFGFNYARKKIIANNLLFFESKAKRYKGFYKGKAIDINQEDSYFDIVNPNNNTPFKLRNELSCSKNSIIEVVPLGVKLMTRLIANYTYMGKEYTKYDARYYDANGKKHDGYIFIGKDDLNKLLDSLKF